MIILPILTASLILYISPKAGRMPGHYWSATIRYPYVTPNAIRGSSTQNASVWVAWKGGNRTGRDLGGSAGSPVSPGSLFAAALFFFPSTIWEPGTGYSKGWIKAVPRKREGANEWLTEWRGKEIGPTYCNPSCALLFEGLVNFAHPTARGVMAAHFRRRTHLSSIPSFEIQTWDVDDPLYGLISDTCTDFKLFFSCVC